MLLRRLLDLARRYYREYVEALYDYREGVERVYAVERLAQLIAQTILDFAAVLASRRGAKPSTYRELALFLSRELELGKELEEFLVGLAGFRNILVHMYAEIDRVLEEKAFSEIEEKTPLILDRMEAVASRDPCLQEVAGKLRRLAEERSWRAIIVFGSLAKQGCGRDVDVAIRLGRKPKSLLEIGALREELSDLLGAPVDLVILDLEPDPVLAMEIASSGVAVYGDGEAEKLRLLKLALDYAERARLQPLREDPLGGVAQGTRGRQPPQRERRV